MVDNYEKRIQDLVLKASKDGKKQTFELMGELLVSQSKEREDDNSQVRKVF